MKTTHAKLCANRRNSQRSTGPTSATGKLVASQNARRHGLLARNVVFQNAEDEAAFEQLQAGLLDYWRPANSQEEMLVEHIGMEYWKLGILTKAILAGLERNENPSVARLVVNRLAGQPAAPKEGSTAQETNPIQMDVVCDYVVMKVSKDHRRFRGQYDPTESSETVQFEARLGNAFRLAARYEGTVTKNLYRAMEQLQELQKARQGGNQTKPKQ